MTESLLNNDRCFLDEEAWKDVLRSLISTDSMICDQTEIAITLHIHKGCVPSIFADVTEAVSHPTRHTTPTIQEIVFRARELRADFLHWRQHHDYFFGAGLDDCSGTTDHGKPYEITGTYFTCLTVTNRMFAAVCLLDCLALEDEAQLLAGQILELRSKVKVLSPQAKLFLVFAAKVASATQATYWGWRDIDARIISQHAWGGVIEKWKVERWCGLWVEESREYREA
jgi:hypothetical protein